MDKLLLLHSYSSSIITAILFAILSLIIIYCFHLKFYSDYGKTVVREEQPCQPTEKQSVVIARLTKVSQHSDLHHKLAQAAIERLNAEQLDPHERVQVLVDTDMRIHRYARQLLEERHK